jgi:hypothetical protein
VDCRLEAAFLGQDDEFLVAETREVQVVSYFGA